MNEKSKVLLVDDSPLIRKILSDMLENDYEVITSHSGLDGYEKAILLQPDIILLDVVMPELDGIETCKMIKKNKATEFIPIIFITSLDEAQDEMKGLEAGAIDYITKPFSEGIVKARIKNHLELKKHRDRLAFLSVYDELTSLYNRRWFDMVAQKQWNYAIAKKSYFSICIVEIDQFEMYNDDYGTYMGDECLKKVSKCIKDLMKEGNDIAARLRGKKFICLLPGADFDDITIAANKIHNEVLDLKIPFQYSTISDYISLSGGAGAIVPTETDDLNEFIKSVDELCYESRRAGGNRMKVLQNSLF